ncbi:hypothetical protein F5Y19DRAFT_465895 [Xylariaceae sp. FL1651]|nr:hypothetical protein F5Y19DRAFT_465895 [Xylariaceae sp. FL1651]
MMFIASFLTVSLASFAFGAPTFLLPCSAISGTPCRCPIGTDYSESVTTSVIGATVRDVGRLMNDFFNTSWSGVETDSTLGFDNIPLASIRQIRLPTLVGTYEMSQLLTSRSVLPDGSFTQDYQQLQGRIPYLSGNGSFSGFWGTIQGTRIFANETLVRFSNYACQTGHVQADFAAAHESALANATRILAAAGKIYGISADPISA